MTRAKTMNVQVASAFLERLYGKCQGRIVLSGQPPSPQPFRGHLGTVGSVEAAVALAERADAAGYEGIYVRTTTLRHGEVSGRGSSKDSAELVGLTADVDYGVMGHAPGRGLPLPETSEQAREIITRSGLPEPSLVVNSGGGLYPWWVLDEPLAITEESVETCQLISDVWQARIVQTATEMGLSYGAVGDLARVLRLPGTINRKAGGARESKIVEDNGHTYSMADLVACVLDDFTAEQTRRQEAKARKAERAKEVGTLAEGGDLSGSALDVFSRYVDIGTVLEAAGWSEHVGAHPREVDRCWTRPHDPDSPPSSPCSAHTLVDNPAVVICWSTSAGLPSGAGQKLNAVNTAAHLFYDGDVAALAEACEASIAGIREPDAILVQMGYPSNADYDRWMGITRRAVDAKVQTTRRDDLWDASPLLDYLHTFALSRMVSPWAVLGGVLLRVLYCTPHNVVLPGIIGGPASLNMCLGVVGASGTGKGAAMRAAGAAFDWGTHEPAAITPGSGESIAHAFARTNRDGSLEWLRRSVMFSYDEVDHMAAIIGRSGSSLHAVIRSMWSGESLGRVTADTSRSVQLPAMSYRATLTVGVQPAQSEPLLTAASGGTPQRFMWLPSTSSELLNNRPDIPPIPEFNLPYRDFGPLDVQWTMGVPAIAESIILEMHIKRMTGEVAELDGHALLTQLKIAAAFALWHDRMEVTEFDWELAGRLMSVSNETRKMMITNYRQARSESVRAAATDRGYGDAVAREAEEDEMIRRTRERILMTVHKAGKVGVTWSKTYGNLTASKRPYAERALHRLLDEKVVVVHDSRIYPVN